MRSSDIDWRETHHISLLSVHRPQVLCDTTEGKALTYTEVAKLTRSDLYEVLEDPDHIVEEARFVDAEAAGPLLATAPRWVREPVTEWLAGSQTGESEVPEFSYVAHGSNSGDLTVERLDSPGG